MKYLSVCRIKYIYTTPLTHHYNPSTTVTGAGHDPHTRGYYEPDTGTGVPAFPLSPGWTRCLLPQASAW